MARARNKETGKAPGPATHHCRPIAWEGSWPRVVRYRSDTSTAEETSRSLRLCHANDSVYEKYLSWSCLHSLFCGRWTLLQVLQQRGGLSNGTRVVENGSVLLLVSQRPRTVSQRSCEWEKEQQVAGAPHAGRKRKAGHARRACLIPQLLI